MIKRYLLLMLILGSFNINILSVESELLKDIDKLHMSKIDKLEFDITLARTPEDRDRAIKAYNSYAASRGMMLWGSA